MGMDLHREGSNHNAAGAVMLLQRKCSTHHVGSFQGLALICRELASIPGLVASAFSLLMVGWAELVCWRQQWD